MLGDGDRLVQLYDSKVIVVRAMVKVWMRPKGASFTLLPPLLRIVTLVIAAKHDFYGVHCHSVEGRSIHIFNYTQRLN